MEKILIGYQARYIIPILPLLLVILNNKFIKVKINCNVKNLISVTLGLFTIVDILGLIIK